MIQRLTRSRGITLNSRPAFLGRKVRAGDVVAARVTEDEASPLPPVPMDLRVLHEDPELLILDKPPGILVHPTSAAHQRTIVHGIAHHLLSQGITARVRPVHRLDRDTSGILIVARTAFAHQHLDRQLRSGEMKREYLAVVEGVVEPSEGEISEPIGRAGRNPNLRAVVPGGQPAKTAWNVIERFRDATLLRIAPETGRTHQIRVHLAHLGHPVAGDRAYGAGAVRSAPRVALHSWRVSLRHPRTNELLTVEAPLPPDLDHLVERLRHPL